MKRSACSQDDLRQLTDHRRCLGQDAKGANESQCEVSDLSFSEKSINDDGFVWRMDCHVHGVCVCVPLVVTGILWNCFIQQGDKARQQDGILELATPAYLHFSEWHEAKPRTSLAADMSDRRHLDPFVVS